MSFSRVQEKSSSGQSGTASVTFTSTSTAGNLLVAVVTCNGTSNSVTGLPSNWQTANTNSNPSNGYFVGIYYYANASAISTVSMTLGSSASWTMFIAEYSGSSTNWSLDRTSTGTDPSTPTSGSITTTLSSGVIVVGFSNQSSTTYSFPSTGFTIVDQLNQGVVIGSAYMENIFSSSGTYQGTASNLFLGANGVIASFGYTSFSCIDIYMDLGI